MSSLGDAKFKTELKKHYCKIMNKISLHLILHKHWQHMRVHIFLSDNSLTPNKRSLVRSLYVVNILQCKLWLHLKVSIQFLTQMEVPQQYYTCTYPFTHFKTHTTSSKLGLLVITSTKIGWAYTVKTSWKTCLTVQCCCKVFNVDWKWTKKCQKI